MFIKYIVFFIVFSSHVIADSLELSSGKTYDNVKIEKEADDYIIIRNEDNALISIEKSKVKSVNKKDVDSNASKYSFSFNQSLSNELPFRGSSVYGENLSRRNNESYKTFYQAWNLATGLSFTTPTNGFSVAMNVYSPTTARTNRDVDHYYQKAPGDSKDYSQQFIDSAKDPSMYTRDVLDLAKSGVDPIAIKQRKEKNALRDIFDTSIAYKWNTKMGLITTGFYFANNTMAGITLGELVVGVKFPFLEVINPSYTAYHRFTSEARGASNHRLGFDHTIKINETVSLVPSLGIGYQHVNNLTDRRNGISDVTTKLQLNIGSVFFAVTDMLRPDTKLYDTPSYFSYSDYNKRDGYVTDPSKVNGVNNKFMMEQITKIVNDASIQPTSNSDINSLVKDFVRSSMIKKYQEQKIMKHNVFVSIGYSIKF